MAEDVLGRSKRGFTPDELHELGGIVSNGLSTAEIEIVHCEKHPFNAKQKTTGLKKEVVAYAEDKGIIGSMTNEETNGKGIINISKESIKKFVDDSASDKSIGKDAHLSVLHEIRNVIANSIEEEVHPDYNKDETG